MEEETKSLKGSPSFEKKKLEHQIEIEDKKYEDNYNSCCSEKGTDKRLLQWVAKFSISMLTLGFAMYGILTSDECDPLTSFYTSLISFILGMGSNNLLKEKK